ncbi:MAG: putative Ig domain-containing protein, partial [Pseudolabrys sp.]|nr:putative Ig domain-containing protein [Pseudolabrys sp.]
MASGRAAGIGLAFALLLATAAASTAALAQGDVIRHPGVVERPQAQPQPPSSNERGRLQNPAVTVPERMPPRGAATPVITTASPLPPATQGENYKLAIEVAGGTAPYVLTLGSGKLPAGLSLKDGIISGIPTAAGSTFALRVTDAKKLASAKQFSLEVRSAKKPAISAPVPSTKDSAPATPPLIITDAADLPPGTAGFFYGYEFHTTGGKSPYTFKTTAGQMPPGLTFVSARNIMGSATSLGTYSFTVTVADSAGKTADKSFSLAIFSEPALTSPLTLPAAIVGKAYQYKLEVTGGAPPVAIEALDSPPAGLTLNAGVISGIPTKSGAFHFTVRLTDGATRTVAVKYYLTVVPPLTIATTTLPTAYIGAPYQQVLTTSGGFPPS